MKSFNLKGYVPRDHEHVIIDEVEYVAHEDKSDVKHHNQDFWNEHCKKCAFNDNERAYLCPVLNSMHVSCAVHGKRYVWFEKADNEIASYKDGYFSLNELGMKIEKAKSKITFIKGDQKMNDIKYSYAQGLESALHMAYGISDREIDAKFENLLDTLK